MRDIVPDLLDNIFLDFDNKKSQSKKIKSILSKISKGDADYQDAHQYAHEIGDILANTFKDTIDSDSLPEKRMYYNIAQRIVDATFKNNYTLIVEQTQKIQEILNRKAGIGLKAVVPKYNADRAKGIIERLSAEEYEKVKWILDEPVKNFSQSIVDDFVKSNADFHFKAGLAPKIVRKEVGNCCDWCKEVVGVYEYPDVPKDVYKRHRYCRCTVEYFPGNGKKQNVWDRKWVDIDQEENVEKRKEANTYPYEQAKTIKQANAFAEKMGFQADYSGIDIKCANEWNKGLYEAKKRFPEVADKIKFVGASQKRYSLMKKDIQEHYETTLDKQFRKDLESKGFPGSEIDALVKDKAKRLTDKLTKEFKVSPYNMASSWSASFSEEAKSDPLHGGACRILEKYHGITMNNKYFNSYGKVIESGLKQVEHKWHPNSCYNVKATFDHEFAHQIDKYLKVRENKQIVDLWESQTKEKLKEALSEYAYWDGKVKHKDAGEMIAEAWSEYCNNENPRELSKIIGKEIERLWKKK